MAAKYKKRADGRYLIQVLIGYNSNGKPKYKNVYAHTIRELEEKAATVRAELEKGIVVKDDKLTLESWAKRWLKLYKPNAEYNTQRMYETTLTCHVYPNIGQYRLKDIKPHHVQELINKLVADGKLRTAEIVGITLSQIFEQAIKNEYIYKNVMSSVIIKKHEAQKKRALTDEEMQIIRSANLPIKEKTFIILLLTTGLRKGEAIALTKNDIDMAKRTITVSKNAIVKSNQMEIKNSPKSAAGNRAVSITDELFSYFTQYLPQLKSLYIFPTANDKFMTHSAFRRMWEKILNAFNESAGGTNGRLKVIKIADDITPHLFRHTYATLLYRAGVDMKTAQYLFGHSSIQMTMDIYTKLDNEKKEDEIRKFNTFMNSNIQSKISQIDSI